MSDIILRSTKGAPLSNAEIDANFSNLNADKIQSGDTVASLNITSVTISGGSISGITDLAIEDGGTGASTAAGARTNLGLAIGTNVQAYSSHLAALVNAQKLAGNFVVGNGTTWGVQSGATARTSLGLGSMATQNSTSVSITGGSISGITDLAIADGGTGASTAAQARTNLGLGSLATANTINNSNWSGAVLSITNGGTGANSAAGARANFGLGPAASVQHGSLGIGTAASGVTGEIRATDNITAYYSSDIRFKENIQDIDDALYKVNAIGGKTFDWTDDYINKHGGLDDYFLKKQDFGVIAQEVQEVFPIAVKERPDGSLAVDYSKLCVLAFAAIKELTKRIEQLESK